MCVWGGGLLAAAPQFGRSELAERRHWHFGWEMGVGGGGILVKGRHVGPDKDSPAPAGASPVFCSIETSSDASTANHGAAVRGRAPHTLCSAPAHLLAWLTSPLIPLDPP